MIIDPRLVGTDEFPDKSYTVAATFKTCDAKLTVHLSHYYTTLEEAQKALESLEERPCSARAVEYTRR